MSMVMVAILMRPWIMLMGGNDVELKILANDIMILAAGKKMLRRFSRALDATHSYLIAIVARISPDSSFNFAFTHKAADWLRNAWWDVIYAKVPVEKDFGSLEHTSTLRGQEQQVPVTPGWKKARAALRRLSNLLTDVATKAKAIRIVVYPAALYGIEVAQTTRANIASPVAAVKDCLYSKNNRHDTDWIFTNGVGGPGLDPQVQIAPRRIAMLRRMVEKKPKLKKLPEGS